jgi:nucleotide-binding universal stress UspA family protein
LDFVAGVAATNDASVRILHIRELSRMARAIPLETPTEADLLVRDSVHSLGVLGIAAEGRSCSVLQEHVARRIAQEAALWECEAIVIGSRRLRGIARLSSRGVRERILRHSILPVLVAPAAESNRIYWPPRFRSGVGEPTTALDRHAADNTDVRGAG